MKASRYNLYLKRKDTSYWYNALRNTYFKLPISLGNRLNESLMTKEGIASLPLSLYDKLKDNGFIVDSNYDELSEIRRHYNEEVESKHAFLVIIPTLNCNYSCWYCIQDHIVSSMTTETMDRVKKNPVHIVIFIR